MRIQTPQNEKNTIGLRKNQSQLPKPSWLKIRPPSSNKYSNIKALLKQKKLYTVCSEANCPNITECWSSGTATFMILGDTCTRACRFCNVKSGNPGGKIDANEPQNIVEAIKIMNLDYVVITCVTRDDLKDGGAAHFAKCIKAIKDYNPKILVEVLISDLAGNHEALKTIIEAKPDVLAHNMETVERLQSVIRDARANYQRSLKILEEAKKITCASQKISRLQTEIIHDSQENTSHKNAKSARARSHPSPLTKTSLMLGLGETQEEVLKAMQDLREIGTDIVTFGQYLQPSPFHFPIKEYITPEQFKKYENMAKKLGFLFCASGPLVRSSYKAGEYFLKARE